MIDEFAIVVNTLYYFKMRIEVWAKEINKK